MDRKNEDFKAQNKVNCDLVLSQVDKIDDILSVSDTEHPVDVCQCLELIIDDYDDTALNVEDNQPLIDFENNLNFSSLRARVELDILKWENSFPQNDDNYPQSQYLAGFELLTILNEKCEIYINDEIVNFCENPAGSIINPKYPLESEYSNPYYSSNRIDFCPFSDCCPINFEAEIFVDPNNSNKRIRVEISSTSTIVPFGGLLSYYTGFVISQRRRNNGNWTRSREQIKVVGSGGQASAYFQDCEFLDNVNVFHDDFRRRRSRSKTKFNVTLTSWAFQDNDLCTTGEMRNAIIGSVCNEN